LPHLNFGEVGLAAAFFFSALALHFGAHKYTHKLEEKKGKRSFSHTPSQKYTFCVRRGFAATPYFKLRA